MGKKKVGGKLKVSLIYRDFFQAVFYSTPTPPTYILGQSLCLLGQQPARLNFKQSFLHVLLYLIKYLTEQTFRAII